MHFTVEWADPVFISQIKNGFIFLECLTGAKDPRLGGWKLHIAVNDNERSNLVKAWDLIKDIVIDHEITQAKVILLSNPPKEKEHFTETSQQGKQITILCAVII